MTRMEFAGVEVRSDPSLPLGHCALFIKGLSRPCYIGPLQKRPSRESVRRTTGHDIAAIALSPADKEALGLRLLERFGHLMQEPPAEGAPE